MHKGSTTIGLAVALAIALVGAFGYSKVQKSQEFVAGDTQGSLDSFKTVGNMILPRVATKDFGIGSTTATSSADFSVDATTGGVRIAGLVSCDTIDTNSDGLLACGTDGGGGGSSNFTGLDAGVTGATLVKITSLSFDAGNFNFANTASLGNLSLDWVNGPASRSAANTWTALNTFSASPLSIQGTSASLSVNFEAVGYASASRFFGPLTGAVTGNVTGNLMGNVTGNSSTATALAANGANCSAGNYPLGVDASGAVENCTAAGAGGSSFNGIGFGLIGAADVNVASTQYDAGGFNLSNTASLGFVRLDYTNGPASRSMANTWTALNTFSAGASVSSSLEVAGTASISTSLRVGGNITILAGSSILNTGGANSRLTLSDAAGTTLAYGSNTVSMGASSVTINNAGGPVLTVGTAGATAFTLQSNGNSIVAGSADSGANMKINTNSGGLGIFSANGFVGINKGAPATGLDVTGNASVSANFEIGGTASISKTTTIGGGVSGSAKALVVNNNTSTGNIFEAQDNGTAVFTVANGGLTTLTGQLHLPISTAANPSIYFAGATNYGIYYGGGVSYNEVGITIAGVAQTILGDSVNGGITLGKDLTLKWSNNTSPAATRDTFLGREAAAILQMGADVNGAPVNQTFKAHDGITGTDIAGANLTIAGGRGTGAGLPGLLQFQTATQLGTGTTAQTLARIGSASQLGWEFGGNASISGVVFQNALGSSSFNGTIVGPSAGVLSIGTIANYLKNVVANVGRFLVTLVVPNSSNPTVSEAGSIAVNTASGSFEYRTSTQTKVLGSCTRRPSYVLKGSDLSAKNQWSILLADDPYSIRSVSVTASGSNSLSWNLRTGSGTVPTTNVFALDKKASGSAIVRYEAFTVASVSDGFKLDVVVTSTSATLDSVTISTCVDADTTD